MTDDTIKNPFRSLPKTQVPYEPEYVRKGINVPPANLPGNAPPVRLTKEQAEQATKNYETGDSWVSMDGDALDDDGNTIPFENGHIIDNNDFVNIGYKSVPSAPEQTPGEENIGSPKVGDYILMVMGKIVSSGTLEKIQTKVKNIMYGEDPNFSNIEISLDNIIVLKRVNIKIGIFIDG